MKPTELLPELKQLIDEADDIAARLEDTLHGEDGKLITNLRYKLVDVLKWWPIEDPTPPPQAGADKINSPVDDQSSSEAGYIKDMNTKELLADAALEWARLILYLQREYAAGKAEFRIAFQSKTWFIVHPLSKDGQTINVNLNESEDDAIEKHLQEWKRLKDEYTKSKAQAGAETVSSGSDKQMAETTTADSGGEVHVTSGADDAETFLKTLPESSVNFGGDLHAAVVDAMEKYARHIAAKAVEDERQRVTRLVDEEIELQTKVFNDRNTPMEMRINAQTKLAGLKFVRTWLNPTV